MLAQSRVHRGPRYVTAAIAALLLVSILAAIPLRASPTSSSDLCGTVVTANFVLDHNLSCSGIALLVGADNVVVSLNGHAIAGPGSIGIALGAGRSVAGVTITGPGRIMDFTTGIAMVGARDIVVTGVTISGSSSAAISIQASNNVLVEDNLILDSVIGVHIRSFSSLPSTENAVVSNLLFRNQVGVRFSAAGLVPVPPTGNTLEANVILMNACGVMGSTADNTLVDNRFVRNDRTFC